MDARNFVAACNTFWQLHRELQTYADAEIAELNLTRQGCVRVAFAAAVAVYGTEARSTEERTPRDGHRILADTSCPEGEAA